MLDTANFFFPVSPGAICHCPKGVGGIITKAHRLYYKVGMLLVVADFRERQLDLVGKLLNLEHWLPVCSAAILAGDYRQISYLSDL